MDAGNAPFARLYKILTTDAVEAPERLPVPEMPAHSLRRVWSKVVRLLLEPAVMTHDSLADELLSQLPINRDTRWTAGSLGLDEAAFDAVAQRLLELESLGAVDVVNMTRDANSGLRRLNAIRFMRVA